MKRIISLIICAVVVLSLSACGEGNTKKDNSNDVVAQGAESNFEWDGNLIVGLTEEGCRAKELVIPECCEGFGGSIFIGKDNAVETVSFSNNNDISLNGVFAGAKKIKSVTLPTGLTKIGNMDFWLCEALEEINIPASVVTIGEAAFQDCSKLKKVVLGEATKDIQEYAFDGCESLNTVIFPDGVETIGEYAFYECVCLNTVTLPKSLKNIGKFAFANGGLTEITVPEEVQLDSFDTTSFIQTNSTVKVIVRSGSWMDQNFDNVFENGYIKEAN